MSAMDNLRRGSIRATTAITILGTVTLFGCDGGSSGASDVGRNANATLLKVEFGRLVDIYSYRQVDSTVTDRRDTRNRRTHLIARNVVVDPGVETQSLFDTVGGERRDANFRFLSFDVGVGHDELVILWDDRDSSGESGSFEAAYDLATASLPVLPASFRDQNIALKPIPVAARDAAFRLTFDRTLGVTDEFFDANPSVIQLLRFRDDPATTNPVAAFEVAETRLLSDGGNTVIIDTTVIGREAAGRRSSTGLVPSPDLRTANYRIAIPTQGVISRTLRIESDSIDTLNGVDSFAQESVIRDFRAGNSSDGRAQALPDDERPTIVTRRDMGIVSVNFDTQVLTLSKRGANLPLRGRIPFVDGGLRVLDGLPGGPGSVPAIDESGNGLPLPSGDFIVQDVISASGESVRIRAEIVENLAVNSEVDSGLLGLTDSAGDGGEIQTVRVRVSTIFGRDSGGNNVFFQSGGGALGRDCQAIARYVENIRYAPEFGPGPISDAERRAEFTLVEPVPGSVVGNGRELLSPMTSVSVRFNKPLDLARTSTLDNLMLTNVEADEGALQAVLMEPKSATLNIVGSRLIDQEGDASFLKISPPSGLFHQSGSVESYWFHANVSEDTDGLRDLAGNLVDLLDRRPPETIAGIAVPLQNFSVRLSLDPAADTNNVGSRVIRFAAADEDGTAPTSIDYFGQFQIADGALSAAPTVRRSAVADGNNLGLITRFDRGECIASVMMMPPMQLIPPAGGGLGAGVLYATTLMTGTVNPPPIVFQPPAGPYTFGGIVEPHNARGSRLQMTYREDDFSLSYRSPGDMNIDIEQMYWSPWADGTVLFDQFDRYTLRLSHSRKRPDLRWTVFVPPMAAPICDIDCVSLNSGLSTTFADNPLPGGTQVAVVEDESYSINPNAAFRAPSGTQFVPYPEFEQTYTWRDSRQASWDMASDTAIGLGGALNAAGDTTNNGDTTASVDSPWIPDDSRTAWFSAGAMGMPFPLPVLVRDQADFLGDRSLDHDPIALPLLADFSIYPDDTQQVSTGGNEFQIAYVGSIWPDPNNGYYNSGAGVAACNGIDHPFFRVHTSGGTDLSTGDPIFVDPDQSLIARGGIIKDAGLGDPQLGLFQTKAGDDHTAWAQIDMIRKVSMVTFGFFDTLQPNRRDPALGPTGLNLPAMPPEAGRPDFSGLAGGSLRMRSIGALVDPPISQQPGGTSVEIEFRGAEVLQNTTDLFNPTDQAPSFRFDSRGNLLNPNYACEAYRYAMPNPGLVGMGPRVEAEGLTPYATEDDLGQIAGASSGTLPRYMNFRLVLKNNTDSNPSVSPKIRGITLYFSF